MNGIEDVLTNLSAEEPYNIPAGSFEGPGILNSIFENLPLILVLVNKEGRVENINRAASITLGKENKDSIGLLGGELFGCMNSLKEEGCGKNRVCTECTVRNSVMHTFETSENIYKKKCELEIMTNDRSATIHFLISTILIKQNNEPMVLLNADDITEQKLSEKALKESETKYKELADSLPQTVFETDLQGNLTFVNNHAFEMFGYAQEDFAKGSNIYQTLIPEDLDRAKLNVEKVVRGKDRGANEYTALRKDGSTFPISIYSSRIVHNDRTIGIRGILVDISEHKQIESALQKSEHKFRTFFNNSNDPTLIYDFDGIILEVNEVACEFTGYSRDELLNMSIMDLDSSEYASSIPDNIKQLQKGMCSIFESVSICKNGTLIPIELSNRIIEYDGKPAVLSTSRNLTERKQAENAMIHAKLVAEAANRTKSEFLANMSHELRTPLNSIIGFSQLLNNNTYGNLNEKEINYSYNIMDSGKHLLDLINDILEISKIESGKIELECEKFSLSSFLRNMEYIIKHLADKKNIEICNQFSSENIEVYADKLRMKQILSNLLSNSLKFTPENGCI